jgi:hypothetical protein
MNETHHACVTACRAAPQIHGGELRRAKDYSYGGRIGSLAGGESPCLVLEIE